MHRVACCAASVKTWKLLSSLSLLAAGAYFYNMLAMQDSVLQDAQTNVCLGPHGDPTILGDAVNNASWARKVLLTHDGGEPVPRKGVFHVAASAFRVFAPPNLNETHRTAHCITNNNGKLMEGHWHAYTQCLLRLFSSHLQLKPTHKLSLLALGGHRTRAAPSLRVVVLTLLVLMRTRMCGVELEAPHGNAIHCRRSKAILRVARMHRLGVSTNFLDCTTLYYKLLHLLPQAIVTGMTLPPPPPLCCCA